MKAKHAQVVFRKVQVIKHQRIAKFLSCQNPTESKLLKSMIITEGYHIRKSQSSRQSCSNALKKFEISQRRQGIVGCRGNIRKGKPNLSHSSETRSLYRLHQGHQ